MTPAQHKKFYLRAWWRCRSANQWLMRDGRMLAVDPRDAPANVIPEMLAVWEAAASLARAAHRGIEPDHLRHAVHVVALKRDKSSKQFTNTEVGRVVALFDLLAYPEGLQKRYRWDFPEECARKDAIAHIKHLAVHAYVAAISTGRFKTADWENLKLEQLQEIRRKLYARASKGHLAPAQPNDEDIPF